MKIGYIRVSKQEQGEPSSVHKQNDTREDSSERSVTACNSLCPKRIPASYAVKVLSQA